MSPEGRAYVLNTRPCLNFLGIDRLDVLSAALGPGVYVPPRVVEEVRRHVAWTAADMERRARREPESVSPQEIAVVENLRRWPSRLARPHVRGLAELELEELALYAAYREGCWLDPGESEVLAVARNRGWVAVVDELAAHEVAEADGLEHLSTLGVLVQAVRAGQLRADVAEAVWEDIRAWWDYAPPGRLAEYLAGGPVWQTRW